MLLKPQIKYIFRKRVSHYNSIEELFKNISSGLENQFSINRVEVPFSGASLPSILKNISSIKIDNESIYHVTGDVNYMCFNLGKKSVLTVHDVNSALKGNYLKRLLKRYIWFKLPSKRVSVITVISEFTRAELVQLIPNQAHKIRVVPNPLNNLIVADLDHEFNIKRPRVLLLGTKPNKNLERTLEAVKDMNVDLIIIGRLSKEQKLLLDEINCTYENHVSLTFDSVVECYKQADILCFASLYEGFGMPIIEAQGVGRPVITSNIGAMKEVAQESACLVDPFDTKQIREALNKIINDTAYRDTLVSQGLKNVERFQLSSVAKQYAEIYNELNRI